MYATLGVDSWMLTVAGRATNMDRVIWMGIKV